MKSVPFFNKRITKGVSLSTQEANGYSTRKLFEQPGKGEELALRSLESNKTE